MVAQYIDVEAVVAMVISWVAATDLSSSAACFDLADVDSKWKSIGASLKLGLALKSNSSVKTTVWGIGPIFDMPPRPSLRSSWAPGRCV